MPTAIHKWLWRCIGRLAFNRITVVGDILHPHSGPIVFIATHRNGALDAAPYNVAVPGATPMVSAQLHRLPLGRVLFHGIAVSRAKDRARGIEANNAAAMHQCIELLKYGHQLFIMPEGSSTLSHCHLPFHRGAARIVQAAMEAGVTPAIVPLGVHYEAPTQWQSRVEVLVGNPIYPTSKNESDLHELVTAGLESVGANFPNSEAQRLAEMLAYACTLGTNASYALALKSFEQEIPPGLIGAAKEMEHIASSERLRLHQGVPLMPARGAMLYALYWLLLLPIIAAFIAANAPVLAAGHIASVKLPDDINVISFWRMSVGLPVGLAWAALLTFASWVYDHPLFALIYWCISIAGIGMWYRFRKLTIALHNRMFHADAQPALIQAYRKLLSQRQYAKPA